MSSLSFVLASQSPRRQQLLAAAGFEFSVRPADIDESPREKEQPTTYALRMASEKAMAAVTRSPRGHDEVVLAADTIVVVDQRILGKPTSREDAREMIEMLAGRAHVVTTSFAISHRGAVMSEAIHTTVVFRTLDAASIARYLDIGDFADKAGAYGIQGAGGSLTARIEGSYTNVVGLPLDEVLLALRPFFDPNVSPRGST